MINIITTPIVGDPNTLLLLHGEDLTDSSLYETPLTNQGATVSTAQSKFGGSSLYFNGASRILFPNTRLNFGSGDFTIDWWEFPTSSTSAARFCNEYTTGAAAGGIVLGYKGDGLYVSSNASNNWDIVSNATAFSVTVGTWTHWAVVRNGNTLSTYRNGILFWTGTISGAPYNSGGVYMAVVGDYREGDHSYFAGYIDEFRISDIARWTANFTPPTSPYVGSSIIITPGGVIPTKYALRRRMMRIFSTARLPKEYQEVEYIQSSGAQYIDSGVLSKSDIKVSMRAALTSLSGAHNLFGALESGQRLFVQYENGLLFAYGAWNSTNANIQQNVFYDFVADFSAGRQSLTVDGATVYTGTSNTQISLTKTVYLAALNLAGTADIFASAKIASCQIYDNNVLIRDFVPCYRKSDGAIGLYDLVNGSFYANAGGGTFTKGADASGTVAPPASGNVTFIYTGKYTDNRISGKGTVRLNSSGVMTVTGEPVTVSVTIVGAGGGAVRSGFVATGGSGGIQTISVTLAPGTYEIIIGAGGVAIDGSDGTAGNGGDTTAFGKTSTGGEGATLIGSNGTAGAGGTPNGNEGKGPTISDNLSGGSPNGGGVVNSVAQNGGDGYVEITFS